MNGLIDGFFLLRTGCKPSGSFEQLRKVRPIIEAGISCCVNAGGGVWGGQKIVKANAVVPQTHMAKMLFILTVPARLSALQCFYNPIECPGLFAASVAAHWCQVLPLNDIGLLLL